MPERRSSAKASWHVGLRASEKMRPSLVALLTLPLVPLTPFLCWCDLPTSRRRSSNVSDQLARRMPPSSSSHSLTILLSYSSRDARDFVTPGICLLSLPSFHTHPHITSPLHPNFDLPLTCSALFCLVTLRRRLRSIVPSHRGCISSLAYSSQSCSHETVLYRKCKLGRPVLDQTQHQTYTVLSPR
ncbi:uncharacterized protein UBRO_20607 [Ustilago bromivora]|uniref:Uncharacterized protein n=1 Tax=Ustilago bromivora TaxID=307758 RepID=A0A1K0G2D1_9BASI|nr:uncharacterized protein UBRO_20607 [Ustilago bromivora]